VTGGSLRAASADPSMSTGAVCRSCEAAATRRGRCELRAGRSELRLGSRRNLPAPGARYPGPARTPLPESRAVHRYRGRLDFSVSLVNHRWLHFTNTISSNLWNDNDTTHDHSTLKSLLSNGRDACMATHHISAHRTHRRCTLRFSPHDLVCTEHSQLYPLRPPSSDSFDGLITPVESPCTPALVRLDVRL